MELNNIKPADGAKHAKRRVGRGIGSGLGKTAGRGHKGQKSRAGGYHKVGFEGGQMPLQRRLPKRGFNNINRIDYEVLNVRDLQELEGKTFGLEELKAAGVLRSAALLLKILGTGEITRAVTVKAHRFSDSAKAKIEKAGGKAILIESKKSATAAE